MMQVHKNRTIEMREVGQYEFNRDIESFDDIFLYGDLDAVLTPGNVLISAELDWQQIIQSLTESYAFRRVHLLL